ncbi:glycosyltransferase family 2 protein [Larkinella rosea]|uniref:Glycosyltransferase family 2 protein n=1 Tax=Larkinella rosea TaxID=2025312 RepID=A0A3P1BUD5_9BACT|nr:glycosyltransferase family 2 protein [Larkinella rosea]RRB04519.1 glycosyltransferase family 2 protein [Larkinella rosea]
MSVLPLPDPPLVSAVMITLNSARILPDVLSALTWCDEVVVVDSGSADETLSIARQFGCRTLHRDFDGFGSQKGFAVSQARNHWVLVVDADEIMTDELRAEIQLRLMEVETGQLSFRGFEVPISLVFLGRLMRYGGEYKMPHLRLFDKRFGNYNTARVHEDVVLNGTVGKLTNHMLHDSYGSIHDYFEKFNRYTTAGAHELEAKGNRGFITQMIFRFPITFIKEYLIKRNFLNGYPGFIWSLFSGMYPVVKYAKLREMRSRHKYRSGKVSAESNRS